MAKERIAILGGGIAALTSAFEITDDPNWQDNYEVTIYQMGWRLGGKCASGRNAAHYDRIEEHGLHIYLGFYDNAFRVIKKCYAEMNRPPGAPLATWDEAFKPHSFIVLTEQLASGKYVPWTLNFPVTSQEPGTGGVLPSPWACIEMLIGWLRQLVASQPKNGDRASEWKLEVAHEMARARDHLALMRLLLERHELLHKIDDAELELDLDLRRLFISVDLAMAAIKGLIENELIFPPYDFFKLDGIDFRDWLQKYGARSISVNSAYLAGIYDLGFSRKGEVGAGTAINGTLRMVFTYKGAVMWKMQAGMGETIIVPFYETLKKRGVKFEFFQRVDSLEMSEDQSQIARVHIGQQVTLKDPSAEYQPLVTVKDLPCWPSEPLYDQLEQGEALRASGDNLEDWWTAWPDAGPPRVLEAGKDFERVILACSVGSFPYIAKELMAARPQFGAMVEALGTRATQAVQLWMARDLAGLGWTLPSPVLDGYVEPLDTWADMTHLLPRESWPPNETPLNLAYLCGGLDDVEPLPPRSDHGYAQRQDARVFANATKWLGSAAGGLWPEAVTPVSFDWPLLVAPNSTIRGPDRLDTQYWISVLNPSDRYVLSLPNTVGKRLRTDGAAIANLLLAGDWLLTGISAGSVEAATMAGMHASRAICGRPKEITGDAT